MADYIYETEDRDGLRWSLNIFPSSNVGSKKTILPLGCVYTPLKRGSDMHSVNYAPLRCQQCQAFINPYCQLDLNTNYKAWQCVFCGLKNAFPKSYEGIDEKLLPAELHPSSTSIEYVLPGNLGCSPVFFFVVNVGCKQKHLDVLKTTLLEVIPTLPKETIVGLMTIGSNVQLYDLNFSFFPKTYMFNGTKEVTVEKVRDALNLGIRQGDKYLPNKANNFLVTLEDCYENLINIVQNLSRDPIQLSPTQRPLVSTGVGLQVAINVLQYTYSGVGARLLLITNNPCTQGPGLIVGPEKTDPIRSHYHLEKEQAVHYHKAVKFYDKIAQVAVDHSIAVDIFSASLDQTGLIEMRNLPKWSGGVMINSEAYNREDFQRTFRRFFRVDEEGKLDMGFNAEIFLFMSKELAVNGAIGHIASLAKRSKQASENEIGVGHTVAWRVSALDSSDTFAFYFEVTNPKDNILPANKMGMVQFVTKYHDSKGRSILKVTTNAHRYVDTELQGPRSLLPGIDQEAAATLVARLAIFKAETEDTDIIGWLDRQLIQTTQRYCSYSPGQPNSFLTPPELELYPQFMFYLRRGALVNSFGRAPDETTFYRFCLLRENVTNTCVMIQPALDAYGFDLEEPEPVLLALSSIEDSRRIYLYDSYFTVCVCSGSEIAQWRKAGYHKMEGREDFAEFLRVPKEDAEYIKENRFPVPFYVETDYGQSQARYLLAALDTSDTNVPGMARNMFSEAVSLDRFMKALIQKTVQK